MPGDEEERHPDGIPTSSQSVRAVDEQGENVDAERTGAALGVPGRDDVERRRVVGVEAPTTITAIAFPPDQFVGHSVTIAGQLTSGGGADMVAVPIVLYNTDDPANKVRIVSTTTDASGRYLFTLTDSVATTHAYTVCAEGRSAYSRAESTEVLVRYHLLRLRDTTQPRSRSLL